MTIFKLIKFFIQKYGRSPSPSELYKLQQKAKNISEQNKVIQFPPGGKDKINPFEPRPEGIKSLDEFKASEDIYEQSMKPKGARPGNINYEAMQEKFPDVKLYGDESFQELLDIEKTGKHPRDKADGGRIGYKVGSLVDFGKGILNLLKKKPKPKREKIYGVGGDGRVTEIDVADLKKKIGLDPESVKKGDGAFELRLQQILSKHSTKHADGGLAHMLGEPRSEYSGGGAGMPPVTYGPPVPKPIQVPGNSRHEQLIKEAQELEILKRKAQGKPTGDSESPADPGRGGLQSILNRPQGTFEGNSISDLGEALEDVGAPEMGVGYRSIGKNYDAGVHAFPSGVGINYKRQFADGGRTGFKEGGMNRRGFLKLAAGLASLPIIGKYFKAAKVASKIKVLGNTTTTMPAWFPDLVDKFMIKGIGKKIDQDLMEYTTKELPGVKLAKHDNGRVRVEGKNAYGESYEIDYTPPGHELIDETTGKAVKTKGEFVANDTRYRQVGPEMDDVDVDYDIVNNIEDIVGGDSTKLEGFAKGTNKTKTTRGQKAVDEAEARSSYYQQERADFNQGPEIDPTDWAKEDPDFATGGLARLLGE